MYNRQLETFLQVARLGSFSKAARAMYITPSAVIQQVNHLEEDFKAELLIRTSHGVSLTPAGKLVYQEGMDIVRRSKALRAQLAEMSQRNALTIGTQFLSQPQLFPSLWAEYWGGKPAIQTRFVMLNRPWEEESEVCIVETLMYGSDPLPETESLPLCEVPICFAVPSNHPLARRQNLRYEDLRMATVVTINFQHMHQQLNELCADLRHHGVKVFLVDEYTPAVFNMCRVNGYVLQIPACWSVLCMGMKILPCEWKYKLSYGFYFRRNLLPKGAEDFLQNLRTQIESGNLHLEERFSGQGMPD